MSMNEDNLKPKNGISLASILLYGPSKTGKTAMAAKIALESGFSFIQMLSPSKLAAISKSHQVETINQIFKDAYQSRLSLIILDDIEGILRECSSNMPQYTSPAVKAIRSLLGTPPPNNVHGILVIVTARCSKNLRLLGITMDQSIHFQPITDLAAFENVIKEGDHGLLPEDRNAILGSLGAWIGDSPGSNNLRIPVGILLKLLDQASQVADPVESFKESLGPYLKFHGEEEEQSGTILSK